MTLLHRLVAALACTSFLITGGLGESAHVYVCTDVDGEVRVETPFNRCCDDDQQENHDAQDVLAVPAVSVSGSGNCGLCSDEVLTLGKDYSASLKVGNQHQSHLVLLPAILLPSIHSHGPLAGGPPLQLALAVHGPVESVVLRC